MNDKDEEAFENWFDKVEIKWDLEEAWQAACEYKQKEIDNQKNLIDECEDRLKKSLHFLYEFEKLQAENAKLRECVEFYANIKHTIKVKGSVVYSPERARQLLKELDEK